MTGDILFFYAFATLILTGAVLTVISRSAVHSAVWLIVSLLGTAGIFLLQKAEFLFAVQIILYIGGIMVLFLFVIMLVNLDQQARDRQFNGQWWLALLATVVIGAEAAYFSWRGLPALPPMAIRQAKSIGNTELLADVLFSEYLLPFEVASLLLLAAMVGSVVLARAKEDRA